jgi:hypothetical protein
LLFDVADSDLLVYEEYMKKEDPEDFHYSDIYGTFFAESMDFDDVLDSVKDNK